MKISVFYDHILQAAEQTGKPVPALLKEAKDAGIAAVEINMTYLNEHEETYALLKEAGLDVSCVYEVYEMDSKDETKRAQCHVATAKRAGAGKILVVPGFFSDETKDYVTCIQDYEKTAAFLSENEKALKMANGLKGITAMAKEQDILTVIEDFDNIDSPIACVNGMKWFLEQVPDLRVTFDTGNFIIHKEDIFIAWEALKEKVVHVHCKDRGTQSVAVGDGYIPMKEILGKMKESGYKGYLAIEHFDASDQETCIQKSAQFLKSNF